MLDEHEQQQSSDEENGTISPRKTSQAEAEEESEEESSSGEDEGEAKVLPPPTPKSPSASKKNPKRRNLLTNPSNPPVAKRKPPKITLYQNAEVVDTRPNSLMFNEKKMYKLGGGFFLQIGRLEFTHNVAQGIFFIKPARNENEKTINFNLPLVTLEPLYNALAQILGK